MNSHDFDTDTLYKCIFNYIIIKFTSIMELLSKAPAREVLFIKQNINKGTMIIITKIM